MHVSHANLNEATLILLVAAMLSRDSTLLQYKVYADICGDVIK